MRTGAERSDQRSPGLPRHRAYMRGCGVVLACIAVVASACGDGDTPLEDRAETAAASTPQVTSTPAVTGTEVSGTAPQAVRGFPSVVLLRPVTKDGGTDISSAVPPSAAADTALIDQITMQFFPGFLILSPGQTVEFRNSETDAAHNVRVTYLPSDSTLFNVGTAQGIPYFHSFEEVGGYHVTCDIHSGMDAAFLVTDAPLVARGDAEGAFAFPAVPEGDYAVEVWSMDETLRSDRLLQVGAEPLRLDLTGSG